MSSTPCHFRSSSTLAILMIVVGILLGATNGSRAGLIAYESFEPAELGAFDGTADQTWTLGAATETIEDKDLSYSGGDVTINSGGRVLKLSGLATISSPVASFNFTEQSGPVYFSYLAEVQSGAFFEPWVGNSANTDHKGSASLAMDARWGDVVTARLMDLSFGTTQTGDLEDAVGGLTFVVGKLFKSGAAGDNYDRLQVVVNPTSTTEPGTWDGDITRDIEVDTLDRFGLRYGNTQAGWIDEIRIGTTYGSVIPEPSTLAMTVMAFVALLGLSGRGRRRCD